MTSVRERLERRREELRQRAAMVRADLTRQREPLSADFAEQAVQRENDDVLEAIKRSADEEIAQIGRALRRLDEGTYGICTRCHGEIEPSRLEAVPHAERCSRCADRAT
ncbi:MAG: TraR/DksA C4-type zinc finger protein [Steroidobacteraceae bacterium]|nr:TraR/DksA C4-type zinc finger protein [Steroidobacteraceae bacterium]MDW8258426.1 TraR/DksA C4-type zinc finger protein [Gammaproteobacteria bacterium]